MIVNPHDPAKDFAAWIDHEHRFGRAGGERAATQKQALHAGAQPPVGAQGPPGRPIAERATVPPARSVPFRDGAGRVAGLVVRSLSRGARIPGGRWIAAILVLAAAYGGHDRLANGAMPGASAENASGHIARFAARAGQTVARMDPTSSLLVLANDGLTVIGRGVGGVIGLAAAIGNGGAAIVLSVTEGAAQRWRTAAPGEQRATLRPTTTVAMTQGIADRRAWEAWFAGLSGDARAGAEFWAGERSERYPVPCETVGRASPGFVAGCRSAKSFLDQVDLRRRSEPDYWRGWNTF